jgi:hypothetical protein
MNSTSPWRTFSIFISSTFWDMQAERDYLKNNVCPLRTIMQVPKWMEWDDIEYSRLVVLLTHL